MTRITGFSKDQINDTHPSFSKKLVCNLFPQNLSLIYQLIFFPKICLEGSEEETPSIVPGRVLTLFYSDIYYKQKNLLLVEIY